MNTSLESNQRTLTGTHFIGGIFTEHVKYPTMEMIQTVLPSMIVQMGLTELGSVYHLFEGGGYTVVVALAESHLSIHTWPELAYVTLDVFICNVHRNNAEVCEKLFFDLAELFHPLRVEYTKILR